jgi:alkanesulfonate monooxygenase SsuD/methylene tetrahydromethanopterin reductase-like flavin-dependent oxidoreductase (luciferase family)
VVERRDRITFGVALAPALGAPLVDTAKRVEAFGFDAFYVGDHPGWDHDCWVRLALLAGATARLRIGPLVACTAYRPPVVTARLAADVDRLSGGRLVLGLGIGWDAAAWGLGTNEFARLGLPYPPAGERQDALEEAVAIMRGAWGAELFSFAGRHYAAAQVQVAPPPLQVPGPPLVIAGAGERTLDQVARLADACNFGPGPTGGVHTPAAAHDRLAALRRRCEAVGRPVADVLPTHFTTWLMLGETEDAVRAKVARSFPGGLDEQWSTIVVARTPEEAIPYYQGFADAGMRHFVVQSLDPEDDETFRLLAERVVPAVAPPPAPST